jgi:hypothetical protein
MRITIHADTADDRAAVLKVIRRVLATRQEAAKPDRWFLTEQDRRERRRKQGKRPDEVTP